MPTIEIDFEVFKAITAQRPDEETSANDVLREVFGLPARKRQSTLSHPGSPQDWMAKGVRFPAGTEFRATYKGQTYLGRVEGGALVLNGKRFDTPSAAAMSVSESPVNGWTFWEARLPGQVGWRMIRALRPSKDDR